MKTKTIEDVKKNIFAQNEETYNYFCEKHTEIIKNEKTGKVKTLNQFLLSVLIASGPNGLIIYEYIVDTLNKPNPSGWDVVRCYSYALDLGIAFPVKDYMMIVMEKVGYDNAYFYSGALMSCIYAHGIEVEK